MLCLLFSVFSIFVLFNQILRSHACTYNVYVWYLVYCCLQLWWLICFQLGKYNDLLFILFESSLWSQVNTQGPDNGLIWVQLFNFKKQLSCLG